LIEFPHRKILFEEFDSLKFEKFDGLKVKEELSIQMQNYTF